MIILITTTTASAPIHLPLVAGVRPLLVLLTGALVVGGLPLVSLVSLVVRVHGPLVPRVPAVVVPHRLLVVLPRPLTLVRTGLRALVQRWGLPAGR